MGFIKVICECRSRTTKGCLSRGKTVALSKSLEVIRMQDCILLSFYFTIQDIVKYCNRAWKKCCFFLRFFWNISKMTETIKKKKLSETMAFSLQKAQISEDRINYILIILSKCLLVGYQFLCTVRSSSKTSVNIKKTKFLR